MKSYRNRILFPEFHSFHNNKNILTNINNNLNIQLLDFSFDLEKNIISIKMGKKELMNIKYEYEKSLGVEMNLDLIEKTFSASLSLCLGLNAKFKAFFDKAESIKFDNQIIPGISFEFAIKPFLNARICFGLGYYQNLTYSNESYFFINVFGEAEIGVNLEAGVYIPSSRSPIFFGVSLGLKGVLGSGKIGFQLNMFFRGNFSDYFSIDLFYELQALSFTFYVKMKFQVTAFFTYSFEFYILNIPLIAYKKEFHKIRYYKYNDSEEVTELCHEITIDGWTSIFMKDEDKEEIKKISPCQRNP